MDGSLSSQELVRAFDAKGTEAINGVVCLQSRELIALLEDYRMHRTQQPAIRRVPAASKPDTGRAAAAFSELRAMLECSHMFTTAVLRVNVNAEWTASVLRAILGSG